MLICAREFVTICYTVGSIKQKIPRDPVQVMTNSRYLIMAVLYFLGTVSRIPISQGRDESLQISEQLVQMKAELRK